MSRRGLTVLELLVSLSVLVVVGGMGYEAFRNLFEIQRVIEQRGRMIAGCRLEMMRATHELANLAPDRKLRDPEGAFEFDGQSARLLFSAAALGDSPYLNKVVLEPRRPGVSMLFAYHAAGAPLEQWENEWQGRDTLPDLIRITASSTDPRGEVEDVTLSTLVRVRVQP